MTPEPPTLAALLLALREGVAMSQTEAAVHAGVAPKTWRLVERGERSPTVDEVVRLADACRATQDQRGALSAAMLGGAR